MSAMIGGFMIQFFQENFRAINVLYTTFYWSEKNADKLTNKREKPNLGWLLDIVPLLIPVSGNSIIEWYEPGFAGHRSY